MDNERFEKGYQLQCKLRHITEPTPDRESMDALDCLMVEHVYGDLYSREGLSLREHLFVTVISIAVIGGADKILRDQMLYAMNNGMTRNELEEIILHMSAYCGFERAVVAKQTLDSIPEEPA